MHLSIKNQNFKVVTDTVIKTDMGERRYYVYLKKYGKKTLSKHSGYWNFGKGKKVCVVLFKGIFGERYSAGEIYLYDRYYD